MRKLIILSLLLLTPTISQAGSGLLDGFQITPGTAGALGTLGVDTNGDYVSNLIAGNGISTTGAAAGETISHTVSVNQAYAFNFTGNVGFTPSGTNSLTVTSDANSFLVLPGLLDVSGDALCIDGSNNTGTCAAAVFTTSVSAPALVSPATGSQDDILIKPAGVTALTVFETGAVRQHINITSKATCDATTLGMEIMYRKGAGASETTSKCVCEEVAGPVYVWSAMTSTGDCT